MPHKRKPLPNPIWGLTIRNQRKKLKLTQKDLAEKLGVVRSTVCFWEQGLNFPSEQYAEMLYDILGIDILGGND